MAVSNRFIPHHEATPEFNSDIFDDFPERRFVLVCLGKNMGRNVDEELFTNYLRLRANVYVYQTGMLPDIVVRPDGTEVDDDDERSTHFTVVENRLLGRVAAVSAMRLIEKDALHPQPLPIQQFFPEAFGNEDTQYGSVEVSRLISCIDERPEQIRAIFEMFKAGLARVNQKNLGPVYGVVEKELEQSLEFLGAPPLRIAEPKHIEEYNDYNVGIEIDTDKMSEVMGKDDLLVRDISPGAVHYWGRVMPTRSTPTAHRRIA